jgi:hypothetical protein
MPLELQRMLDLESKLDRSSVNIELLIAEGEKSARRFPQERKAAISDRD